MWVRSYIFKTTCSEVKKKKIKPDFGHFRLVEVMGSNPSIDYHA